MVTSSLRRVPSHRQQHPGPIDSCIDLQEMVP
eukprot:CAMPEP_0194779974 /NCGR_PEP_ID=MMETSP0323_2-20130528/72427_1 /TAXON_ID=2866 ORGANISM="Crypthecodinium cohnii, Strain Seligo" /NCGR_SAMPLE_ID=MMETSP0323_2 /ASSEMBLY_ACC=CAM_ASM_000346 /LENGTH=31 /DNA_ID= /DNA_START= /DNA_END= /DNA_ORIENTATION=